METELPTDEEMKLEKARTQARVEELRGNSTAYLLELARVTGRELFAINTELERRTHKGYQKVITVPCQARELETALTTYMNSHGLAGGTVNLFPDDNGDLAVFICPPKEDK